jgi:hypothetical protein
MADGGVYFIQCRLTNLVKIGFSQDPEKRLAKIQSDSPGEMSLMGVVDGDMSVEAALHERFAKHRARGEWFHGADEIIAYASTLPGARPHKVFQRKTLRGTALNDDGIARVLGCARATATHYRAGTRPITLDVAARLFSLRGEKVGPLLEASDEEARTVSLFVLAEPYLEPAVSLDGAA